MFKSWEGPLLTKQKYGSYSPVLFSLVPQGVRVLDVGCSTGALARRLKESKGCRVTGLDIDRESLAEAAAHCEQALECDLDNLSALREVLRGELFDAIILGDILEHFKYPADVLAALKDCLTDQGVVLASIPNAAFVSQRLRFLRGDFSYDEQGGLMDEEHLRFFDFKTARLLFEESGYCVRALFGSSVVRKRFWFLAPLAKILPSLFALHIIVVAEKV